MLFVHVLFLVWLVIAYVCRVSVSLKEEVQSLSVWFWGGSHNP